MSVSQRQPKGYLGRVAANARTWASRVDEGAHLWNDARRSAKFDDSLLIWIPKNAGTSISTMLQPHGLVKLTTTRSIRLCFRNSGRVTFGHISVPSLVERGIISSDFVDRAFKFAFSRDPYSRAVSLYRYLLGHTLSNWHEQPTFGEFLTILASGHYDRIGPYNSLGLSQCNPQVEWIEQTGVDKIYKVEELDHFISDICDRWDIPRTSFPHENRTESGPDVVLTREEKSLIRQIYAEDFERFGYSKR